jgi:hypothetical protein
MMGSASGGFLTKGHQVVVTLGVLPWGKATRACSRLVVSYFYCGRRGQYGARAPSFGLCLGWCGSSCCALPVTCALRPSLDRSWVRRWPGESWVINAPQFKGLVDHKYFAAQGVPKSWVGGGPTPPLWISAQTQLRWSVIYGGLVSSEARDLFEWFFFGTFSPTI